MKLVDLLAQLEASASKAKAEDIEVYISDGIAFTVDFEVMYNKFEDRIELVSDDDTSNRRPCR